MAKKYEWDNYLIIESEFIEAKKYLSFERQKNYEADSPFLHNEIVLLGSQVETAMKKLISYENPDKQFSPGNISDYKRLLLIMFPELEQYTVSIINTEINLTPFSSWSSNKLAWWDAYSKIKHGSSRLPKLEHALNLLAAYAIILHLIHFEESKMEKREYIFYSFREMPQLLVFAFECDMAEEDFIGYGYAIDQYKICADKSLIKEEIETIKKEREDKKNPPKQDVA